MKSYFVYCRKSSESSEKQALSLQAQERELKAFAKLNNLKIKKIYRESKSARIPDKRIEFYEMVNQIRIGKVNKVLTWHTNRLSRNWTDSGMLMQMITDGEIQEIRTPQDIITPENANDILLGVQFGANSQYSKELSYNTKRGIREKIALGQWPTYAPEFYRNYGHKNKDKNIEPDPRNYQYYERLVDEIIKYRLNVPQAIQLLKKWGVKTKLNKDFGSSTVHRILRNPVYCGVLRYSEYDETNGTWIPLISMTKWDRLQEVLDDHLKPLTSKWSHTYNGLFKCGKCGLSITGQTKVKSNQKYTYYSCTKRNGNCGNSPITLSELELLIVDELSKLTFNETFLSEFKDVAMRKLNEHIQTRKHEQKKYEDAVSQCLEDLNKLVKLRLDNELSKEEFANAKKIKQSELKRKKELINDTDYNFDELINTLEKFFEELLMIKNLFINGNYQEKRKIIRDLCDTVYLEDKKLSWNFKYIYKSMINYNQGQKSVNWGR